MDDTTCSCTPCTYTIYFGIVKYTFIESLCKGKTSKLTTLGKEQCCVNTVLLQFFTLFILHVQQTFAIS